MSSKGSTAGFSDALGQELEALRSRLLCLHDAFMHRLAQNAAAHEHDMWACPTEKQWGESEQPQTMCQEVDLLLPEDGLYSGGPRVWSAQPVCVLMQASEAPTLSCDFEDVRRRRSESKISSAGRRFWMHSHWILDEDLLLKMEVNTGEEKDENTAQVDLAVETKRILQEVASTHCWGRDEAETHNKLMMTASWGSHFDLQLLASSPWSWQNLFRAEFPMSPHSRKRLTWDILGLLLVLYDAITIPLHMLVMSESDASLQMDIAVNGFWTIDMLMSFLTSVFVDGELKTKLPTIARHYLRTWFFFDALMVLPEWIVLLMINRRGFSLLRFLRFFRIARLLRLLKMENVVKEQLKRVNSLTLLNIFYLMQLTFVFLILNHVLACGFFYLGKARTDSWLEKWILQVGHEDDPTSDGYLLALQWSISQFHGAAGVLPGNKVERIYGVVTSIGGMLIFSVFVSIITDMIFAVRHARKKYNDQTLKLRSYFLRHKVSAALMLAVKRFVEYNNTSDNWVEDMELLAPLPLLLQKAVLLEARTSTIGHHCLFAWLHDKHATAFRDICHASFVAMQCGAGSSCFAIGDSCQQIYFVESGTLRYVPVKQQQGQQRSSSKQLALGRADQTRELRRLSRMQSAGVKLSKGMWTCELGLWIEGWQNTGNLFATSDCSMLTLDSQSLSKTISCFPVVRLDLVLYAKIVLQKIDGQEVPSLSDLWRLDMTADAEGSIYEALDVR